MPQDEGLRVFIPASGSPSCFPTSLSTVTCDLPLRSQSPVTSHRCLPGRKTHIPSLQRALWVSVLPDLSPRGARADRVRHLRPGSNVPSAHKRGGDFPERKKVTSMKLGSMKIMFLLWGKGRKFQILAPFDWGERQFPHVAGRNPGAPFCAMCC